MATNKELEKRIETLEKEVQHLKAVLQYQMRNKKKWFILIAWKLILVRLAFPTCFGLPNLNAKY